MKTVFTGGINLGWVGTKIWWEGGKLQGGIFHGGGK